MCGGPRPENPVDVTLTKKLEDDGWQLDEASASEEVKKEKSSTFDVADAYHAAKAKAEKEAEEIRAKIAASAKVSTSADRCPSLSI